MTNNENTINNEVVELTEAQILMIELKKLQDQIAELQAAKPAAFKPKKNHVVSKASPTRRYVLLTKTMKSWGKIPQQQADLATILTKSLETGVEYTEDEVFGVIIENAPNYVSLASSKQDPTYLFRYYRGLKPTATHGGFISRELIRMIEKES